MWNLNQTLKAFGWDKPFQGYRSFCSVSQGWRCAPTAGLKLANAFGVPFGLPIAAVIFCDCKLTHYEPIRSDSRVI
jgi:hypothetical protein